MLLNLLLATLCYPTQQHLLKVNKTDIRTNLFGVFYTIWYYLYNLKKVENTHAGVLLLAKLQTEACNITKSNIPPWMFFTFFNLYKWYQIILSVSFNFKKSGNRTTGNVIPVTSFSTLKDFNFKGFLLIIFQFLNSTVSAFTLIYQLDRHDN